MLKGTRKIVCPKCRGVSWLTSEPLDEHLQRAVSYLISEPAVRPALDELVRNAIDRVCAMAGQIVTREQTDLLRSEMLKNYGLADMPEYAI
jgi:hypothetical protein